MVVIILFSLYIFLNGTPTTEFYTYCHTLSLLDALPISRARDPCRVARVRIPRGAGQADAGHDPAAGGARCTRRTRARSAAGICAPPLQYARLGPRPCPARAPRPAAAPRRAAQPAPRPPPPPPPSPARRAGTDRDPPPPSPGTPPHSHTTHPPHPNPP